MKPVNVCELAVGYYMNTRIDEDRLSKVRVDDYKESFMDVFGLEDYQWKIVASKVLSRVHNWKDYVPEYDPSNAPQSATTYEVEGFLPLMKDDVQLLPACSCIAKEENDTWRLFLRSRGKEILPVGITMMTPDLFMPTVIFYNTPEEVQLALSHWVELTSENTVRCNVIGKTVDVPKKGSTGPVRAF